MTRITSRTRSILVAGALGLALSGCAVYDPGPYAYSAPGYYYAPGYYAPGYYAPAYAYPPVSGSVGVVIGGGHHGWHDRGWHHGWR